MRIAWHESLKFDQLTLGKIIKIGATRCHILRLKCTKFNFGCGFAPDPAGGAYSAPPDLLAGLRGPNSKGRGEDGREGKGTGRGGRRGREGTGRVGDETPPFTLPLIYIFGYAHVEYTVQYTPEKLLAVEL